MKQVSFLIFKKCICKCVFMRNAPAMGAVWCRHSVCQGASSFTHHCLSTSGPVSTCLQQDKPTGYRKVIQGFKYFNTTFAVKHSHKTWSSLMISLGWYWTNASKMVVPFIRKKYNSAKRHSNQVFMFPTKFLVQQVTVLLESGSMRTLVLAFHPAGILWYNSTTFYCLCYYMCLPS